MGKLGSVLSIGLLLVTNISWSEPTGAVAEETKGVGEEVDFVITANRRPTSTQTVANSVTVITSEDLERSGKRTVQEVLRGIPGVDVVRSGGLGGNTVVFMRGANSEHTLVMIDGVEANTPGSPNRAFNFADLTLDQVERIEVLRGPQSTLYGSDAIGGVIQIFTKRGQGPLSGSLQLEAGSFATFTEKASLQGGDERGSFALSVARQDSDSISAAESRAGNSEKDGYSNTSLVGRGLLALGEHLELDLSLRSHNADTDLDNAGGVGGDDPNRRFNNQQLFLKAALVGSFWSDKWQPQLAWGYAEHDQRDDNDPDFDHFNEIQRSSYDSRLWSLFWQNDLTLGSRHQLVSGVSWEQEQASSRFFSDGQFGAFQEDLSKKQAETAAVFLEDNYSWDENFFLTTGMRLDHHSTTGSEITWRIAPVVPVSEVGGRVKLVLGSGFKSPSLYQLYSAYGNEALAAEESISLDLGWEQDLWQGQVSWGVTYFQTVIDNLITFDPNSFLFENIAEARIKGGEFFIVGEPVEDLLLKGMLTYTDSVDGYTNQRLLRRPRFQAGLSGDWSFSDRGALQIHSYYVGSRIDNDFSNYQAERISLGGYTVVDVAVSYSIAKRVTLTARIDNLFDKNYQEVNGYGALGIGLYGGVKITL